MWNVSDNFSWIRKLYCLNRYTFLKKTHKKSKAQWQIKEIKNILYSRSTNVVSLSTVDRSFNPRQTLQTKIHFINCEKKRRSVTFLLDTNISLRIEILKIWNMLNKIKKYKWKKFDGAFTEFSLSFHCSRIKPYYRHLIDI